MAARARAKCRRDAARSRAGKGARRRDWIHHNLYKEITPIAKGLSIEAFLEKFNLMEGIVEAYIEGEVKSRPWFNAGSTQWGR